MSDLRIERQFAAPADRVFEFVTRHEHLLKWWGPEGMSLPEETLDFTKPGPWHSVMMSADGNRFKVSGEVTSVDAPNALEFTWAWHDDQGQRGPESRVRIDLISAGPDATTFVLTHADLLDDESRKNHGDGWTSSIGKLERQFA